MGELSATLEKNLETARKNNEFNKRPMQDLDKFSFNGDNENPAKSGQTAVTFQSGKDNFLNNLSDSHPNENKQGSEEDQQANIDYQDKKSRRSVKFTKKSKKMSDDDINLKTDNVTDPPKDLIKMPSEEEKSEVKHSPTFKMCQKEDETISGENVMCEQKIVPAI